MSPLERALRGVVLLATSALVVCGVKGPPRPPAQTDAGAVQLDAGAVPASSAAGAEGGATSAGLGAQDGAAAAGDGGGR